MGVNNLLMSVRNIAPALLGVGSGKGKGGYDALSGLNEALNKNTSPNANVDKVNLTFKKISEKLVTDMAAITARTIKEFPDLDGDYVIALVGKGEAKETRVYKRSDILDNFKGTDEEKKALEKQLKSNPLMLFENGSDLPPSSSNKSTQALSANLNEFLKLNRRTVASLIKAGYDPFVSMKASESLKKTLLLFAGPKQNEKKDGKEVSDTKKDEVAKDSDKKDDKKVDAKETETKK